MPGPSSDTESSYDSDYEGGCCCDACCEDVDCCSYDCCECCGISEETCEKYCGCFGKIASSFKSIIGCFSCFCKKVYCGDLCEDGSGDPKFWTPGGACFKFYTCCLKNDYEEPCWPLDPCTCFNGRFCGLDPEDRACALCCRRPGYFLEITRSWFYGSDDNERETGRNFFLRQCLGPLAEHRFVIILTVLLSIFDTVTDFWVAIKWFTSKDPEDRHIWEAGTLVFIMATSWIASACLCMGWKIHQGESRCKWSLPFHFIGLGTAVEGLKAFWDHDLANNYTNVNPYKWIEIMFEAGPSALLTCYVISKESIGNHNSDWSFWSAEGLSITASLVSVSFGMSSFVTQQLAMEKEARSIGERGWLRFLMGVLLILSDLIFRIFLFVLWIHFGNIFGIHRVFAKFLLMAAACIVIEMIFARMVGQIAAWWQLPLQAYTAVYQGGVTFFMRTWKEKGHRRNVAVFWLRYACNWALFVWIYFYLSRDPANPDAGYISFYWTYSIIIAASVQPILFMLKPPSVPPREAYPFIRAVTKMGWKDGMRASTMDIELGKFDTSTSIDSNPAGGRVNWNAREWQSTQTMSPNAKNRGSFVN